MGPQTSIFYFGVTCSQKVSGFILCEKTSLEEYFAILFQCASYQFRFFITLKIFINCCWVPFMLSFFAGFHLLLKILTFILFAFASRTIEVYRNNGNFQSVKGEMLVKKKWRKSRIIFLGESEHLVQLVNAVP